MTGILEGVNRRTQLVGQNRLELLLFRLGDKEWYGINVFKVREVIQCPKLTTVHSSHPVVRGVSSIRGNTLSIMDLGLAINGPPIEDIETSYIIITEFNRSIQGFLVNAVEHIVNMNWEDIKSPPEGTETNSYMTAITEIDGQLIQVIDVERVLTEVLGEPEMVSNTIVKDIAVEDGPTSHVLVVDDSSVARNQIKRTLERIGVECTIASDGREALEVLQEWAEEGQPVSEKISMVISDIEMPVMDGYTLTSEIRRDPRMKDLYILLHSSLSGVFNTTMVEKVGADAFIAKFSADDLVNAIWPIVCGKPADVPKAA